MNWWAHERMWSAWICGGRYITAISRFHTFETIFNAVMNEAEDRGHLIQNQPVVLVNANPIGDNDWVTLTNTDGIVTLVLE